MLRNVPLFQPLASSLTTHNIPTHVVGGGGGQGGEALRKVKADDSKQRVTHAPSRGETSPPNWRMHDSIFVEDTAFTTS